MKRPLLMVVPISQPFVAGMGRDSGTSALPAEALLFASRIDRSASISRNPEETEETEMAERTWVTVSYRAVSVAAEKCPHDIVQLLGAFPAQTYIEAPRYICSDCGAEVTPVSHERVQRVFDFERVSDPIDPFESHFWPLSQWNVIE